MATYLARISFTMPSQADIMPNTAMIIPAMRFIIINCLSLNFLRNTLIVVVSMNHHVAVPRKTPTTDVGYYRLVKYRA